MQVGEDSTYRLASDQDDAIAPVSHGMSSSHTAPILRQLLGDVVDVARTVPNDNFLAAIITNSQLTYPHAIWTLEKSFRMRVLLPWDLAEEEYNCVDYQSIYAIASFRDSGPRFDSVYYNIRGQYHYCILQHIVSTRHNKETYKVTIIRRLVEELAHDTNRNVVHKFGHKRFAFDLRDMGSGEVRLDCCFTSSILYRTSLVRDLHDLVQRHGLHVDPKIIQDCLHESTLA